MEHVLLVDVEGVLAGEHCAALVTVRVRGRGRGRGRVRGTVRVRVRVRVRLRLRVRSYVLCGDVRHHDTRDLVRLATGLRLGLGWLGIGCVASP